ncbi:hypothetical protein BATDEDRAFT_27011 [Batrachochytrium dendrobatidis JAM81]|uniref:Uncharacterized protein n=1 Tax=Batrachochytrium dendrobatidis (strain JAM81 / FGSC 10211) TaxID=684364 RepID=F4P9D4_BATDJ|nr:uncharacterized protein BATDEDRAFT_27011 [Batrachochytrium dendrobatidis JAM81]EGF78205.1 hypothetical protein BATDEDRAFT_27011 [Batrachochytrium dendrobatidis JAM81]|eukprot:XP_006681118.1 hypothetical protein BATDEDRAFT_27011 [Batrachochytrium dendrobatidis JAM81]
MRNAEADASRIHPSSEPLLATPLQTPLSAAQFTSLEIQRLEQLLSRLDSFISPTDTPFKKHILPSGIRSRLFSALVHEFPQWPHSRASTEQRLALMHRHNNSVHTHSSGSPTLHATAGDGKRKLSFTLANSSSTCLAGSSNSGLKSPDPFTSTLQNSPFFSRLRAALNDSSENNFPLQLESQRSLPVSSQPIPAAIFKTASSSSLRDTNSIQLDTLETKHLKTSVSPSKRPAPTIHTSTSIISSPQRESKRTKQKSPITPTDSDDITASALDTTTPLFQQDLKTKISTETAFLQCSLETDLTVNNGTVDSTCTLKEIAENNDLDGSAKQDHGGNDEPVLPISQKAETVSTVMDILLPNSEESILLPEAFVCPQQQLRSRERRQARKNTFTSSRGVDTPASRNSPKLGKERTNTSKNTVETRSATRSMQSLAGSAGKNPDSKSNRRAKLASGSLGDVREYRHAKRCIQRPVIAHSTLKDDHDDVNVNQDVSDRPTQTPVHRKPSERIAAQKTRASKMILSGAVSAVSLKPTKKPRARKSPALALASPPPEAPVTQVNQSRG